MAMQKDSMQNKSTFILFLAIFILSISGGIHAMAIKKDDSKGMKEEKTVNIYLVKSPLNPKELNTMLLSEIPLENSPFITYDDILAYDSSNHSFVLTDEAYKKFYNLDVPVRGRAFMVTVGKKPVYLGAFWIGISSIPYPGIAIEKPVAEEKQPLKIQLGYPDEKEFKGKDYRNDPALLEILKNKERKW